MSNVLKFDVLRIKEKMRKNCHCQEPKYEIDTVNNTVECATCGAYVDPMTALYQIALKYRRIDEYMSRIREERQELDHYKPRLRIIKFLEQRYSGVSNALVPSCPHCKKFFDLEDLRDVSWQGRPYYEQIKEVGVDK